MTPSEAQTSLPVPGYGVVAVTAPPGRPDQADPNGPPAGTRGRVRPPVLKPYRTPGPASTAAAAGPPYTAPVSPSPPREAATLLVCCPDRRGIERGQEQRAVRWHLDDRVLVHGNKSVVFE